MKTIFGLFGAYPDAQAAVNALLDEDFDEGEMNLIVQTEIAKDNMDVDLNRVKVEATAEIGRKTVTGLEAMLAGEQPVNLPDVGNVYAAGELATIMTSTAAMPGETDNGLESALVDFNVSKDAAEKYRAGVESGELLFFIRTDDERASQSAKIIEENGGGHIAGFAG